MPRTLTLLAACALTLTVISCKSSSLRYQIIGQVGSNNTLIKLDTLTGETWFMRLDGTAQPTEGWKMIPRE